MLEPRALRSSSTVQRDPEYVKMGLEYVEVYLELLNDPTKALPFAMEEYTARPDNIDVNHALARVYKAMGNQTKAQEHFQKAMRTNSKNPELLALAQ
jgi:Tfp pilus assembly protein PilF